MCVSNGTLNHFCLYVQYGIIGTKRMYIFYFQGCEQNKLNSLFSKETPTVTVLVPYCASSGWISFESLFYIWKKIVNTQKQKYRYLTGTGIKITVSQIWCNCYLILTIYVRTYLEIDNFVLYFLSDSVTRSIS